MPGLRGSLRRWVAVARDAPAWLALATWRPPPGAMIMVIRTPGGGLTFCLGSEEGCVVEDTLPLGTSFRGARARADAAVGFFLFSRARTRASTGPGVRRRLKRAGAVFDARVREAVPPRKRRPRRKRPKWKWEWFAGGDS